MDLLELESLSSPCSYCEANREWEAWLHCETEAESKGLLFNDPLPGTCETGI